MRFKCSLEVSDTLNVAKIDDKVRFSILSQEPVVYLDEKELKKLIKYLQKSEEK